MNALLYLPAFILGFPLSIGIWLAGLKVYRLAIQYSSKQTAFIVAVCAISAAISLMTAPFWLLGWKGYVVVSTISVVFVGIGAPHVYRTLRFLALELDSDPDNDVHLPGDEPVQQS